MRFFQEQDTQFRYIALELCSATLSQFVTDPQFDRRNLDCIMVLHQATCGLSHLHSLNIGTIRDFDLIHGCRARKNIHPISSCFSSSRYQASQRTNFNAECKRRNKGNDIGFWPMQEIGTRKSIFLTTIRCDRYRWMDRA